MNAKPIIPRQRALLDVEHAIEYYLREAGAKSALGFIDELERAYYLLSQHPKAGSTRHAHDLDIPELRSWRLRRYFHIVFYIERDAHVDVWRVLGGETDIPKWLDLPEAM